MTQTITTTQISSDNKSAAVDIYYHPNNSQAGIEHKDSRYRYSVEVQEYERSDIVELVSGWDFTPADFEELEQMNAAFGENDVAYRVSAGNGIDNLGLVQTWFSSLEDAINAAESCTC